MFKSLLNAVTGKPVLCVYDVTTRCNSRCAMCSIWKRREKEMSLKEVEKIFRDLKRFGIHTVFIQGGEPLLKKEIFGVVRLLNGLGFNINIITNGILLDENVLKKLDSLNTRGQIMVTVSLDTFDRAKYRKIRGVDRLDVVTENIRSLSNHAGLRGGVHATVTSINYMELDDIRKFAHELGLALTFNTYNDVRNYASGSDKSLSLKKDIKIEEIIRELEKVRDRISPLNRAFINENIRYLRGEPVGPCDAFVNSLRVTSEGKLTPCLEIPPVHDLKKEDINEKWNEWSRSLRCYIKRCYTQTPCFYGCTRGLGTVKKDFPLMIRGFATAMSYELFGKGRLR